MEKAIKRAIKTGWRKEDFPILEKELGRIWIRFEREENQKSLPIVWQSDILLDSLFWQALGKIED